MCNKIKFTLHSNIHCRCTCNIMIMIPSSLSRNWYTIRTEYMVCVCARARARMYMHTLSCVAESARWTDHAFARGVRNVIGTLYFMTLFQKSMSCPWRMELCLCSAGIGLWRNTAISAAIKRALHGLFWLTSFAFTWLSPWFHFCVLSWLASGNNQSGCHFAIYVCLVRQVQG